MRHLHTFVFGLFIFAVAACGGDTSGFQTPQEGDGSSETVGRCPIDQMVYVPGSDGPFVAGAPADQAPGCDPPNWMVEYQYPAVEGYCILRSSFPAEEGAPYYGTDDFDNAHGWSYADLLKLVDSQVLADIGLRLPTGTEWYWLVEQTWGQVDIDRCATETHTEMLTDPQCQTSEPAGIELGVSGNWLIYDDASREAHRLSFDENGYTGGGYPSEEMVVWVSSWGFGVVCINEATGDSRHQHACDWGGLYDSPASLLGEVDPDNLCQPENSYAWRDDRPIFVSASRPWDMNTQWAYDNLVARFHAADDDKAVLWDPSVGETVLERPDRDRFSDLVWSHDELD